MTPTERSTRGRIGAFALHAAGKTNTEPARSKFLARFDLEVDPNGTLEPRERAKRAEAARKCYFSKLALKSSMKRRKKRKAEKKPRPSGYRK